MMIWGRTPEFASKQMPESTLESDGEAPIKAYRDQQAEKGKFAFGSQKFFTDSHQSSPPSMAMYTKR